MSGRVILSTVGPQVHIRRQEPWMGTVSAVCLPLSIGSQILYRDQGSRFSNLKFIASALVPISLLAS